MGARPLLEPMGADVWGPGADELGPGADVWSLGADAWGPSDRAGWS